MGPINEKRYDYLTPSQYVKRFGVCRSTVYNWIESGELNTRYIGPIRFIEVPKDQTDVIKYKTQKTKRLS